MKRIAFLFVFFLFGLFFYPQSIFADSKVNSTVNMQYDVRTSGTTHVTAHITLTNTTDTYYVSSYALTLGFPHIANIAASDPKGVITPITKQTPTGEEVTINFNDIVTGNGHSLPFTISFDTPDIANQNGSIWEVNIPGLSDQNQFSDFTVDLTVPSSFGKPTFVKPAVGGDGFHFTKDQLGTSGISLAFGKAQVYTYSLTYHLQDSNVIPIRTEIALPPTTNYQDVELDSLSPKPDNVVLDSEGNWLAQYSLSPSQKLTITANGLISVSLTPKQVSLSDKDRQTYLKPQSYWQVDNSQIASLARELKTPEAIYQYVVSHLTYDFNRVTSDQVRLGALNVLQNPTSAVCLEFTDLFVTLTRAAGIPAREVDGFAYTQNTISRPLSLSKDVLHAWPEYYDDAQQAWIMVDPTWGNTTGGVDYFHTLDFDHVAFVVKGVSSTYPVPAGGYKFADNQNEKDVSVTISQQQLTEQPTITMNLSMPQTFLSGLPIFGNVTLSNTAGVLFPSQPITITAHRLSPYQQFVTTPAIPPFGNVSNNFGFHKTPFLTNLTDTITISLRGQTVSTHIAIVPFTKQVALIGGISLAILIFIIFVFATRPRRV